MSNELVRKDITGSAYTPLAFASAGNNSVYCDSPEEFNVGASYMVCMWGASVGTAYKDVELYSHLKNADVSSTKFRFGIAVQNTTSQAVRIDYKYAGKYVDRGGSAGDADALSITDTVLYDYINGATKTANVPAGGMVLLAFTNGQYKDGSHGASINFHGRLKASVASGVYFRVFVAGANKINSLSELFKIPVASWEQADYRFFCGELSYSQKNATLNASGANKYLINEWSVVNGVEQLNNTGEYEGVLQVKEGGLRKHAGNYGIIYHLTIHNARGKRIRITPTRVATKASGIGKFPDTNTWGKLAQIPSGGCWYRNLGNTDTATVDFILPGGNNGNLEVSFD